MSRSASRKAVAWVLLSLGGAGGAARLTVFAWLGVLLMGASGCFPVHGERIEKVVLGEIDLTVAPGSFAADFVCPQGLSGVALECEGAYSPVGDRRDAAGHLAFDLTIRALGTEHTVISRRVAAEDLQYTNWNAPALSFSILHSYPWHTALRPDGRYTITVEVRRPHATFGRGKLVLMRAVPDGTERENRHPGRAGVSSAGG